MNKIWTSKHIPATAQETRQENARIAKEFCISPKKGKALLIYGPPGCGKTSSVYAIANELGLEIMEMNASDFRDSDSINSTAGSASQQMSLFAKGKIILIDELDGIGGNEDRGGISALTQIIEKSRFPIIITANDPFDKKFSQIRKKSILAEYYPLRSQDIAEILGKICEKENIQFEEGALKALASRSGGDIRGAINDLQLFSGTGNITRQDIEELGDRNREGTITEALLKIFRSTDMNIAINAFENVDEDLGNCLNWIDENLPSEYQNPDELRNAFVALSTSDMFNGRIRRSQHWRLLVYVNAFISAGVALAKETKSKHPPKYIRSTRGLKIYIAHQKYAAKAGVAAKIAEKAHCSTRSAYREYLPYIKFMSLRSRKILNGMASFLELDEDEIAWLER